MRASLWVAVSAFLLSSGAAYATDGRASDGDDKGRADDVAEAYSVRSGDREVAGQGSRSSSYDLSTVQPEEVRPQGTAGVQQVPVTVDPAHPGGDFPWGG